jgi:hypothetical protein
LKEILSYNAVVSARKRALVFLPVAGLSLLGLINLCNMLFRCGCQSWWGGADRLCNIHVAEAAHCPWCSYGWWGFLVPLAAVWLAQAGVVFVPSRLSWAGRLLLGLVCFPAVGAMAGLLFALFSRYPVFLLFHLS